MREVVVVPTFQRQDMLYCCLEAIRAAEPAIPLHVFPDRGTDEEEVCGKFGAIHHLTLQHTYHGNSFNMLEALKWAYQSKFDRVFIIEDDAIIDPTFFTWCREALANPMNEDCFAACGWQYSPNAIIGDGPDLRMPWYLSVCAAIDRRNLYWIVQHARPEYYANMKAYLDAAYPQSHRRGSNHYEQDGLVLRVLESQYKRCVWPRRPRATHVGFTGYHMPAGQQLEGSLEERAEVIRLAVNNPAILRKLMNGGAPPEISRCGECGKALLSENKNAQIVCVSCFHEANVGRSICSSSAYYIKNMAEAAP